MTWIADFGLRILTSASLYSPPTLAFIAGAILMIGGQGRLKPSPGSLRVASKPSFEPIAMSVVGVDLDVIVGEVKYDGAIKIEESSLLASGSESKCCSECSGPWTAVEVPHLPSSIFNFLCGFRFGGCYMGEIE